MTNKENRKHIEEEDKDFGFPFVDVVPLEIKAKKEFETEIDPVEEPSEVSDVAAVQIPAISEAPKSKEVLAKKSEVISPKAIEIKKQDRSIVKQERKKNSKMPLYFSMTLLVLIMLGAMAYFLYYIPEFEDKSQDIVATAPTEVEIIQDVEVEASDDMDVEELTQEIEEISAPVASAVPQLKLVQSRETNPRYFIIVGSVISENFARREAEKYMNDGYDTWIVFPYNDIRNFRIAIGQFESLDAATPDWEAAKKVYGNEIWILKY